MPNDVRQVKNPIIRDVKTTFHHTASKQLKIFFNATRLNTPDVISSQEWTARSTDLNPATLFS